MKRTSSLLLLVSMVLVFSCIDNGIQNELDRAAVLKDPIAGSPPVQNFPGFNWKCNMLVKTETLNYHFYAFGDTFISGYSQNNSPMDPMNGVLMPVEYNDKGNPVKIRSYSMPFDSTVYVLSYTSLLQLKRIVKTGYGHYADHSNYRTNYDFTYETNALSIKLTNTIGSGAPTDGGLYKIYFNTEGRIKEKRHYEVSTDASPHHIMKYAYNSAGNLLNILWIIPNEGQKTIAEFYSYDNRKSLFSTNKVWQLLFEQYSTNNPTYFTTWHAYSADSKNRYTIVYDYNGPGYPTHLEIYSERFHFDTNQWGPLSHQNPADVTYDCTNVY